MNNKSQIFTLIAIALLVLFFVSYEVYSIAQDRHAIKTRISTMDSFLFSLEKNLEREIYVSGYRAIFLAEDKISKTGAYIPDMSSFIYEAFFNGTVSGNSSEILNGTTYSDILQSVNEKAGKINVNININNPQISISHESPWNVALIFSFDLEMNDNSNLASWKKHEDIKSLIEIEGFEDPIYLINTNGKVAYKFNRTIYEGNYVQAGNPENLNQHVLNRYYAENPDAPSFLKRLQGDLSADANGIESLADLSEFTKQGLVIQQKSIVDHTYFSSNNPASRNIQGLSSWFRLDDAHLAKYNAAELAV
jgi:hypothetical protein